MRRFCGTALLLLGCSTAGVVTNGDTGDAKANADADATPTAADLRIVAATGELRLSWTTGGEVVLCRDTVATPSFDGCTRAYQGAETSHVDAGLPNGVRQYYALFALDAGGQPSAPAIASATPI